MSRLRRINGYELDGTCITMTLGRTQVDITKCAYGDSLTPEELRVMGKQTIEALTRGGYATDGGAFTLPGSVWRAELGPKLDAEGFGNREYPIIFSYTHPELGSDSDLVMARIIKLGASGEQGGKAQENEFGLKIRQIFWTEDRKTINDLGDIPNTLGISQL